ncbi:large-conductance mechanosensitive channel [Xylaria nigripes]|nr:large-conductance mechanosensitive channel [Xylaria nigripes]
MPLQYGSTIPPAANTEEQSLLEQGEERAKRMFASFIDFAFSGNILEIAFGLMSVTLPASYPSSRTRHDEVYGSPESQEDSLANAFTTVTNSFVNDILLPPLSVMIPLNRNMDEKFFVLRPGPNYEDEGGYNTIGLAKEDGAVVLAYGGFIRNVVSFLCLGVMLYALASTYQYFSKDDIIKHTVKCRYCKKRISVKAVRCINCTSWLDGREERMH